MFQYRQVLVQLRAGESDREIARTGLMGREKVAAFRGLAGREGWLDATGPMPDEALIAAAVGTARKARSTISSVEPWRSQVTDWLELGTQGKAIHATLCREHGFTGSYSAVHRLIRSIRATAPVPATVPLSWALADTGYRSEVVFEALAGSGCDLVVALGREGKQALRFDPQRSPRTAAMAAKLQTREGKAAYRRRKAIAEPPNGWIKNVLGFRQFSLRGLERVSAEWKLVCMALNLRRMAVLSAG